MNVVVLVGNLTRDPEIRYAGNGTAVAHLQIAVNKTFVKEGGPDADFFRVTAFGKQAELCERYLSKGRKVGIEGRIENSNYTNKEGQMVYRDSIIANRIEFLSPKGESPAATSMPMDAQPSFGGQQAGPGSGDFGGSFPAGDLPGGVGVLDDEDDDLPF
jgi:single-strand DNA-binding protein